MLPKESKEPLHLADIGGLAVQQFLGQGPEQIVLAVELVQIFQTLDHATGISLNHHAGDFGIGVAAGEPHPCHHVRHGPDHGVQFRYLPASGGGDAVGLGFNGIIFLELGFQGLAQGGAHIGVQHTADANLTHLGSF